MNKSTNPNPTTNSPAKLRGNAIIALRAFIKALELKDGDQKSTERYRYEIPENGNTARIFETATGATVEGFERTLEEWAKDGKKIRLAFIGLKDAKIALDEETDKAQGVSYVRYTLNAITGEAFLSRNTTQLEGKPVTIEEWAKLGREVEKPLFESLKAAQDYGSESGEKDARDKMIARGIIRAPRDEKKPARK